MKLLFDHNLSPGLVSRLRDVFPQSEHVFNLGLHRSSDMEVREYARQEALVIVTKDADFSDLCVLKDFLRRSFGFGEEIARREIWSSFCATISMRFKLWKQIP